MPQYDPKTVNALNFDPTAKAKIKYLQAGMTGLQYKGLQNDWLKQQAINEGREYKTGYVPKGYKYTHSSPVAEAPSGRFREFTETWNYRTQGGKPTTTMYWKPEAYQLYRKDLPAVPWDTTKEIQNYWHNPSNVISWMNRLRVQDDSYEPPDWLDTKFLESQYEALKHYNGDEDDPLYWKPLPFGSEEAYLTNYAQDPNGSIPIYDEILKDVTQYEGAAARLKQNVELAEAEAKRMEQEFRTEQQLRIAELDTLPDAKSVIDKLSEGVSQGYFSPEAVTQTTKFFQEQGLVPLEDGTFMKAPDIQPEGGDYANLRPWQKFFQTIGGQVAMQNQPEYSQNIGKAIGSAMPALGIWGMTNMVGGGIAAAMSGASIIGGGAAAAGATTAAATAASSTIAAAGLTILGAPALPVIGAAAAVLGVGTALYLFFNKDNANNTVVQNIFRMMNVGGEVPERAMGAINIASELGKQGEEVDWSAAYDAGYMLYEMEAQPLGNFLLNTASIISEGIDRVGLMFGKDWDLSSGETATGNEVWRLSEGYAEPQEAEIDLAGEGLLVSYEQMKALGDDRTRDEMELEWAYLTSLTGTGGTYADFLGQSFIDVTNFIPAAMDEGMNLYATAQSKKFAALGDMNRATAFANLAKQARDAIGNPLIDALPMGVQQLTERITGGWDSWSSWMQDTKMMKNAADYKTWKALNPYRTISKWARGTQGLPYALNSYMAQMAQGYKMPNSEVFQITPGGRVADTISLVPGSDGSLMISNIDGSETWSYTPDDLRKIDVYLETNKDGNLRITGVPRLLKALNINDSFSFNTIDTTISWEKPVDPVTGKPITQPLEIIEVPETATYRLSGDDNTYEAVIDNKVYTAMRDSGYVVKITDENGNRIPVERPLQMSESPSIIEGVILSPAEAQITHDHMVLSRILYSRYIPSDFKSSMQLDEVGFRAKLTELGVKAPLIGKIIEWGKSWNDLTPGTKAMLEAENVKGSLEVLFMLSSNNFLLSMNGLKKMIGAVDIGRTTKAAEAFIGGGSTVAAVTAALKHAFADGSMVDAFIDLYKTTQANRAMLTKIAKSLGVKITELPGMKPEDIFKKVKNKTSAKNDPQSLEMMQMMQAGIVSEDSITKMLEPFVGKHAAPITDQGYLASVAMYAEKNIQDFLIEKYGVKKLDTWSRLSSMKKAMLSPLLIAFPYTTWLNNLYSNIGAQIFLTGGAGSIEGKTGIRKMADAIGLDNLPAEYGKRMGMADDVLRDTTPAVNKVSMTLNPNDTIGKVTRALRNWGGAIKAYSKIEQLNSAMLFVQEVKNLHSRILLPDFPVNIVEKFKSLGGTDEQLRWLKNKFNRGLSAESIYSIREGTEYDTLGVDIFRQAGESIYPNDPEKAGLVREMITKLFDEDDFVAEVVKIKDPSEMQLFGDVMTKHLEDMADKMAVNSFLQTRFEAENIYTKEGMAGGINIFMEMLFDEMTTRLQNSYAWGDAMATAKLAQKAGDYAAYDNIIRRRRKAADRMFQRSGLRAEALARGLLDKLNAGDADAKRMMDVIVERHTRSADVMKRIASNYDNFLDGSKDMSFDDRAKGWEDVLKRNEAFMDEFDALEIESVTAIGKIWVELLGGKVASNVSKTGASSTDLQAGGRALMKRVVDGMTELNRMRKSHFASIKDLSGDARIAANTTFWGTDWAGKASEIRSMFIDGNWEAFFRTGVEPGRKTAAGAALGTEAPAPLKPDGKQLSPNERRLVNSLSYADMDAASRAKLDALKANQNYKIRYDNFVAELYAKVGKKLSDPQKAAIEVVLDSYHDAYAKRNGSDAGEWLDPMTVQIRRINQDTLKLETPSGGVIEAAGITNVIDMANKIYEITVSNSSDFTTVLRELDRVVFYSDLVDDADMAILVREGVNLDLTTWKEIVERVQTGKGTNEDKAIYVKGFDFMTDTHRKWMIKDASKSAMRVNPELAGAFYHISETLRTMLKNVLNRISRIKVSKATMEVFERLHGISDETAFKERNVGRMAQAPQGTPIKLHKPLIRSIEVVDGVRVGEAYGVTKGVNAGIVEPLELLNSGYYTTYKSSSGMPSDYPDKTIPPQGYISFKTADLDEFKIANIKKVAGDTGFSVKETTRDGINTLEVLLPYTEDFTSLDKINELVAEKVGTAPKKGEERALFDERVRKTTARIVREHGGQLLNDGLIAAAWSNFTDTLLRRVKPSKMKPVQGDIYEATPKIIGINYLVPQYSLDNNTRRLRVNTRYDSDAYPLPPKRITFTEIRDLARSLDPDDLITNMRKEGIGAILVDRNANVIEANDTVLAMLYAKQNEPGLFKKYQEVLKKNAKAYGFQDYTVDKVDNGILVLQVNEGWERSARVLGENVEPVPEETILKNLMRAIDDIDDASYPFLRDKTRLKKTLVTPESHLEQLQLLQMQIKSAYERLMDFRKTGSAASLEDHIARLDEINGAIDAEVKKVKGTIKKVDGIAPGLAQTADEVRGSKWYNQPARLRVQALKQTVFTVDQARAIFEAGKKAEWKLLDIDRLLESGEKITKDDMLAWIDAHSLDLEETLYDQSGYDADADPDRKTRYERVNIPGGENYRELLIRVPTWTKKYQSGHWVPQNVLAHIRFDVRIDPSTGSNVLNLLEIQSDWAQQARKGAAETPPITNFGMLALKRMLRYAVDEGFDTLTFSTGKTAAEIEGMPIDIGGEKMKPYYDEILVNDFNRYIKQWGLKVEDGEIQLSPQKAQFNKPSVPPLTLDEAVELVSRGETLWYSTETYPDRMLRESIFAEGKGWGYYAVDRNLLEAMLQDHDYYSEQSVKDAITYEKDTRTVHKVTFNDALRNDIIEKGQPLLQQADEVRPTLPITERPVGSEPVHMDTGAAYNEMLNHDIPAIVGKLVDLVSQRMEEGGHDKYNINIPESVNPALKDLMNWAAEQQRLRIATILDGANRTVKDIMIDYSRKRGIDQYAEMIFPFQFWYTRSVLMWMKRMVAKPNVMAMAYRYMELRRRNEMTGFPSRQGGKSPVYAPWLPEGMGDWMFVNPWSKFFTPEQLFQPIQNFANMDANITSEAKRYINELVGQGTITPEAAKLAIETRKGDVWEDAVQYTRLNTMPNETDPFTMATMFLNPDPMINALYQSARGTPEKISPLPLTRIGNSFEAIGEGDLLGIIGTMLSAPEDWIRKKAGLPQAGEYGDYYVDFFLSNMSVTSQYSVDQIKQAMISRSGAAFDEATKMAQQYIAYRTPGTAFYKAIKDGHWKDPNVLASAFLASFLPAGLFPEGEMELRGLKDEYSEAWKDYERGDLDALENFNEKYPEYGTRMMMFQEPTERLRAHLINMIWETYTALPSANQQIAADSLGDAFKAYFLDKKTRNYEKIDEGTLTTWARKLGYQAPILQGVNEQAAQETVDPMKYYPEDTAATIQTFLDQRKEMFPNYFVYQGVYFKLDEDKRKDFLKKFPIVKDYWDWKDEQAANNPTIQSYLDARAAAASADGYDTEYDVEAVGQMLTAFDDKLMQNVIYYQFTGEPMSTGTKAALKALFDAAGKPGGDFNIWLQVILGE